MTSLKQLIKTGFTTRQAQVLKDLGVIAGLDDQAIASIAYYNVQLNQQVSHTKDRTQSLARGPAVPVSTAQPLRFEQYDLLNDANVYRYGDGRFGVHITRLADANGIPINPQVSDNYAWNADRAGTVITLPSAGNGWVLGKLTDEDGDYGLTVQPPTAGWYSAGLNFTRA